MPFKNKEDERKCQLRYRLNNKEEICKRKHRYYCKNKDKFKVWRDRNKLSYAERISRYPWQKYYKYVMSRCYYDKTTRYYKKIKCFMKPNDFKFLWFRDKAYLMEQASIHRINSKDHYEIYNCQFIEFKDHVKIGK